MNTVIRRAIAVLYLLTHIAELIKQAQGIVLAMTNNLFFPSPVPSLGLVTKAIQDLSDAEVLARTRGTGMAKARDLKKAVLVKLLRELQFFVQGIADANPDQSEAIIVSAGMLIRKLTPRQKNRDEVRQGDVSGLVMLIAAVVRASKVGYFWEWSTDEKSWTSLPVSFTAATSVSGLVPGVTHYFRYRSVSRKTGTSDWSQTLSLMLK
jgi:hypothetical protein